MAHVRTWLNRSLLIAAFTLLVIVGLPLFLVVAIAMRPLLIAGLVVGGVGCLVLCYFSPPFRAWFESVGESQISCSGLRLATEVAVHPSHSWARIARKNVAVGADDFVPATLGPVESIELPPVGSRVEQGDRLFSLRRGDRCLELRAPVSGTVMTRNEALLQHPHLVNKAPFTEGWAVRLRADNIRADRRRLLEGRLARNWFRQQVDRLIGTLTSEAALLPTLPDGGTLVPELYERIDDSTWERLRETFFDAGVPPT